MKQSQFFYFVKPVLESVGTKWRGLAGSMMEFPYGLGHGCTAVFGYYFRHWRHLHLAAMVPIVLFLLMMFFVDESPRWLVSQGQAEKAEKILRGMAKRNGKEGTIPANFSDIVHQLAVKVLVQSLSVTAGIRHCLKSEHRILLQESGSVAVKESSGEKLALLGKQLFSLFRTPKMRRRTLALNFCWFSVAMVFNGGAFNGSNLTGNLFLCANFIDGFR